MVVLCHYVIAANNNVQSNVVYQRTKQQVVFDCYTVLIEGLACIIIRFLKKESEYLKIINLLNVFTIYRFTK